MKTLIVFSHLRWDFVFQRPQHLLSRLSKHYEKIVFVEEPKRTEAPSFIRVDHVTPRIDVLVPHTNVDGWGFNEEQIPVIERMLWSLLDEKYPVINGYDVWFYTPQALPFLRTLPDAEVVIFDVMDELSQFAGAPPELKAREHALLNLADVVIAGGPSLWEAKAKVRPDTLLLPSAVDADHYSPANALRLEAEKHIEDRLEHDIPHPRIGFFGVIDERLDVELVAKIADSHPEWAVVMVGPIVKIDPAILPQRKNIHWLGPQLYADLPMIVQGWDVCMMPFALNDSTRFISPTKTLEYMAAEKPVVSTAINDVVHMFGSVVWIGNTHEEFIAHIDAALNEPASAKERRLEMADSMVWAQSWDAAASKVVTKIENARTFVRAAARSLSV